MKTIDRRIRALETLHPTHGTGIHPPPRWFIEGQHDERIFNLLQTVAAYENQGEHRGLYTPPTNNEADAARAELRERLEGDAEQSISEYSAIWRKLQDEC